MRNNNWVFGLNCGLDFSNAPAPPTATSGFLMDAREGCSSISNENGQLLFYTNGSTIWDGRQIPFPPITGLKGHDSSTQGVLITTAPGTTNQYYIFTMGSVTPPSQGTTAPIEHFNGGLLNIDTWVFTPLANLPDTTGLSITEKLTAIPHQNCKDFWILTMVQSGNELSTADSAIMRVFLLDDSGLSHLHDTKLHLVAGDYGYMKFNHSGDTIAFTSHAREQIHLFGFDNNTGEILSSSYTQIDLATKSNHGLEFSPNGQFLYYSVFDAGDVYQIDLSNPTDQPRVGSFNSKIGALQLGPDGRIYIARFKSKFLGAITVPDKKGDDCGLEKDFITLPNNNVSDALPAPLCNYGLPNTFPAPCNQEIEHNAGCGCQGCDDQAKEANDELIERATAKPNTQLTNEDCTQPFDSESKYSLTSTEEDRAPCFSLHYGNAQGDQIAANDSEIFYITVCNKFDDIRYEGLRITRLEILPAVTPAKTITIIPDRLVDIGCLQPCSCQTREFALITRGVDIAGGYELKVDYCYDEIVVSNSQSSGSASFRIEIIGD